MKKYTIKMGLKDGYINRIENVEKYYIDNKVFIINKDNGSVFIYPLKNVIEIIVEKSGKS